MKGKLGWAAALVAIASLVMAGPKGTVPRSSADKYALHATREKFSIGVVTLSPEQARKQFVSDVNHCCVVIEVAPGSNRNSSWMRCINAIAAARSGRRSVNASRAKAASAGAGST